LIERDDRHDERRREERHVARAFILGDELFERFGFERIEGTLGGRLVEERPELRRDVPRHHKIAPGHRRPAPRGG
jgi:hypothetical protein